MKKVVYLLGAGTTRAELTSQGIEADLTMTGIGQNVVRMSEAEGGEFFKIQQGFHIGRDQDVETIMSLMEGSTAEEKERFRPVCNELRRLFRSYLISRIAGSQVQPKLHSCLLFLHRSYPDRMGTAGEQLAGVLTINYDSMTDQAFRAIYGGVDYGLDVEPAAIARQGGLPPLLKLHGSFDWRISDGRLAVSDKFAAPDYADDCTGWMPPSVYKRPSAPTFEDIWGRARSLLLDCDVLRVIGSSIRHEDFALISLLFLSQLSRRDRVFPIEVIIPDEEVVGDEETHVVGIMQRLPFLGNLHHFSSLDIYDGDSVVPGNPFQSWLLMKVREIEKKTGESLRDPVLLEGLHLGG